jgi:hypothetical protein
VCDCDMVVETAAQAIKPEGVEWGGPCVPLGPAAASPPRDGACRRHGTAPRRAPRRRALSTFPPSTWSPSSADLVTWSAQLCPDLAQLCPDLVTTRGATLVHKYSMKVVVRHHPTARSRTLHCCCLRNHFRIFRAMQQAIPAVLQTAGLLILSRNRKVRCFLVPIMGFGLVYSVHKYGGCSRYYTLHMVDRYCNLVDTTLLHHDFALDI